MKRMHGARYIDSTSSSIEIQTLLNGGHESNFDPHLIIDIPQQRGLRNRAENLRTRAALCSEFVRYFRPPPTVAETTEAVQWPPVYRGLLY